MRSGIWSRAPSSTSLSCGQWEMLREAREGEEERLFGGREVIGLPERLRLRREGRGREGTVFNRFLARLSQARLGKGREEGMSTSWFELRSSC